MIVTMVDLGLSNLGSVAAAFRRVQADVRLTRDPDEVAQADLLVLPGVGAFPDGMAALREGGLDDAVRAHVLERGRPLAGICLGMQLLADAGEEHDPTSGLGIVPGRVVPLRPDDPQLRVPNMGWCDLRARRSSPLAAQVDGESVYFAHSYRFVPNDADDVVATIDYGGEVAAIVERGPVVGLQFHPEKSQDVGLTVLARLLEAA